MDQTCQRCGYVIKRPDPALNAKPERKEVYVNIMVGMWDRDYHLCDVCADMVKYLFEKLIEGRTVHPDCEVNVVVCTEGDEDSE